MSKLKEIFPYDLFKTAFEYFVEQSEKNAISGKANGSRCLYGLQNTECEKNGKLIVDGGYLDQHFGQGAASKSPYIHWHVLSIYYVVDKQDVIMGIEKDRYSHLEELNPISFDVIGNKKDAVAVFFEVIKIS